MYRRALDEVEEIARLAGAKVVKEGNAMHIVVLGHVPKDVLDEIVRRLEFEVKAVVSAVGGSVSKGLVLVVGFGSRCYSEG